MINNNNNKALCHPAGTIHQHSKTIIEANQIAFSQLLETLPLKTDQSKV